MRGFIAAGVLLGSVACAPKTPPHARCPEPEPVVRVEVPEEAAEDVARRYVRAISEAELDKAATIVDSRAVVFESGKDRGLWRDYRNAVLAPALNRYESFEIWSGEATTAYSTDESLAVVTVPIEYQVTFLDSKKKVQSSGSVTFGVAKVGDEYKIMHLHWSAFEVTP